MPRRSMVNNAVWVCINDAQLLDTSDVNEGRGRNTSDLIGGVPNTSDLSGRGQCAEYVGLRWWA